MMKEKLFLVSVVMLIVSFTTFLTSCQNSGVISEEPSSVATTFAKCDINKCTDTQSVLSMFEQFANTTRSMNINSKFESYDFSSAYLSTIEGKDVNIYIVPSTTSAGDDLLVGLTAGPGNDIEYQLYFKKISENEYTLYNESNEPMFSVCYDKATQLTTIINVYGNDSAAIPSTRVRGGWFTLACNAAIVGGCYALSAIGAVPSGGASLGLAVCSGVISLALC